MNSVHKYQTVMAVFMMSVVLIACQTPVIFSEVVELGDNGWHKDFKAKFQVDINDTSEVMDVGMTFSHTDDYPYSNLWLFVDMKGENGLIIKDTLEFFLSETDGRWLGHKKGDVYEVSALYKHAVKLTHPGTYSFEISHGMRQDVLPQITSLEFWMQKTN